MRTVCMRMLNLILVVSWRLAVLLRSRLTQLKQWFRGVWLLPCRLLYALSNPFTVEYRHWVCVVGEHIAYSFAGTFPILTFTSRDPHVPTDYVAATASATASSALPDNAYLMNAALGCCCF